MSADIANSITGQVQAFFVVNEGSEGLPWHRTGIMLNDAPSLDDVIHKLPVGFNHDIEQLSLFAEVRGERVKVPNRVAVYDRNDRKFLGTVSETFSLQQRYVWAQSLRPLTEDHGYTIDSGGLLKDGKTSWLNFKTDKVADIRPGDPVANYVLAADGVTGLRSAMLGRVSIRTVCANTEAAALSEGTMVKLKHRGDVATRWEMLVQAYACSFEKDVELWRAMANKYVSTAELHRFIDQLTGKTIEQEKRSGGTRDKIVAAFEGGIGSQASTYWDMFNAVTEVVSHNEGKGTNGAMNSLDSQWFGAGAKTIAKAQKLIMGVL